MLLGTASEMARLVNESGVMGDAFEATAENVKDIPFDQLIEAIEVTQTKMGITGTTAKEAAETVSGSYDTMIAAGKDFIAGLGNVNTDTLENFHVLSESIETFAGNVKRVLETIWDNLPFEDWQKQLGLAVVAAGPFIAVVGVIAKVVGVVLGVFSTVAGAFSAFSGAIATGATGFAALKAGLVALMGPVGWVTLAIVALIAAGVWLWKNWDEVKAKALELKDKLIEAWGKIKEKLSDGWDAVVQKTKDVWQGLKDFFKETVDNVVTTFQEMPEKIGKFFSDLDKKAATAFSDMGRSISNSMSESDSVVLQKVGAIVGHITDNFDHAYSETGDIFSAIWLTIKMTFEDIIQGVVDWANEMKEKITTKLSEVGTSVSEFFGPFVEIFSQAWNNIKENAMLVWESIKAFFAALLLTIVGLFTGDMELVKEAIGNAWQIIKDNTLQIWENIKGGLLLIWEAIKLKVSETWENIKQKTIETWENVKVSVSEKVESLKQSAIDKFNALKEGIKTAVANLRDNVLAWFERVKTEVPQKIETMKTNAVNKFNEMKDEAIAKAIQLKDDVIAKITEMIDSVGTWISELPGKVRQGFDDAISAAKEFGEEAVQAGRDLIMGFVSGVTEKAQGLIDAVGGAIGGAIGWAKNLLGINSPSRVFKQFGIFTDEGFAEGIKKGAAGVKHSMGNMVGGAITQAESMTGQLNNALAASVSGGYALTANGQLTINQQPAYINLDLGGRSYRAFVEDISNAQSQNVKFEESYSL